MGERYRLLFAGDLHKRMKDITTIRGYSKVCVDIQIELMRLIKELNVTHFISLGDWFDRGYGSDTCAALVHTDIDREMSALLNGNFYGLIGNHIRINMDSNPELFLIQPHKRLTMRQATIREHQIIKTPEKLILNNVAIYFQHYNKDAENAGDYKPLISKECKYHIGLFHSPYVVPTHHLHSLGIHQTNENSKIASCMESIDLAIVGDIHKPLGTFKISKSDGTSTTMIVPGSLTNTDAGLGSRHNEIKMPLIDIDENGVVSLQYITMDLMTNRLTFMIKGQEADKTKLKVLRGNNKESLYNEVEFMAVGITTEDAALSFNAFMLQQGYTSSDKDIVRTILHEPENVNKLLSIYKEAIESV